MLQKVSYGEDEITYEVSFSKKRLKTEISVDPDASVHVLAPENTAESKLKALVLKRARWILRQQKEVVEYQRDVRPRQYISGECHFYMGRRYVLKVTELRAPKVKLLRGVLQVHCRRQIDAKELLQDWYRAHAESFYKKRLLDISSSLPWTKDACPPLQLRLMKKQWGSCSPQGKIILNLHLIKAPRECIDYVILHELCHLQEHNHSPKFYALLQKLMPNWEDVKEKLDAMAEVYLNV